MNIIKIDYLIFCDIIIAVFGGIIMINNYIAYYVKQLILQLRITDYIGIIVYGSYVGERNNDLSDLDVMIIKKNYDTQDCGSLIINGIRVEYFIQDINKLYELVKMEIDNNDPSHLTKFATCEIMFDKNGEIKNFIRYANQLYSKKIRPQFNDTIKFSIFSINNKIEDLSTLINENSFYSVYFIVLEKIRELYGMINGIIDLPVMKIERLYCDKNFATKYISSLSHKLPNQEFINLYLKCLEIQEKQEMLNNLKQLYTYSFGNLEFDPNNFCLKFSKKSPFRV